MILGITMPKLTLLFLLLFNSAYTHGMECEIPKQKRLHNSEEEIILCTEKDSCSLLELPADILGVIVKRAIPNKKRCEGVITPDLFNTIKLLIQLSWLCKKFEYFSKPDMIKATLNLNQETLDDNLFNYASFSEFYKEMGNDSTPFFKVLIAMDANINTRYKSLDSCVMHIKNAYLVNYFITHHDNNVNQQDNDGETPLRYAIDLNKPDIVRVLLEHKADMYLADNTGRTPTDMALLCSKFECIKALIEHGVDTTIKYSRGKNLKLDIAEWAKLYATSYKEKTDPYHEIYKLVTGEEIPRPWHEKSAGEILNDTCIIS